MPKILLAFLLFFILAGCSPSHQFYMPAEYTPHEAVWLGWIDYPPYYQPFIDVAKALYPQVPLKIICNNPEDLNDVKLRLTAAEIDTLKVDFHLTQDNRLWMRDHGATYTIHPKKGKRVVDFGWTMYGQKEVLLKYYEGNQDSVNYHYKRSLGKTGLIDSLMGAWDGYPTVKTNVNMEGGSIEVNGKGTLILCEAVTLQRNPELSKAYIESEFRRVLGVSHIIWLKEGLAEDPLHFNQIYDKYYGWGTFGHTDEFARFVNDSTLLLAWVDEAERNKHPINEMNFYRMKENLHILEQSRDQDGKSFNIIKVPLPDPIYLNTVIGRSGENNISGELSQWKVAQNWLPIKELMNPGDSIHWVAASSYLNYLVTNGAVLLPTYRKSGSSIEKEAKVREIFSQVFPDRKLIYLDVLNLNYHGGGIHCITQQEPALPQKK